VKIKIPPCSKAMSAEQRPIPTFSKDRISNPKENIATYILLYAFSNKI
jgi:hypothetical protein